MTTHHEPVRPRSATAVTFLHTHRIFLTLCLLILVNQLGFGIITPVLPLYADSFGLGPSLIGVVIGVYGLARFLANVPAGRLAEARGRRTVLIGGTLLNALASALIATAQNLPQLLVYRVLGGAGAAAVLTAGQIMVGDLATPANRARLTSAYQGFFLTGLGLGPLPGGLLAGWAGLRAPFIALALCSALAGVVAMLLITETKPAARASLSAAERLPRTDGDLSMWTVAASPAFVLVAAVTFVQFFARTGALFNVVPLLGRERIGISPTQIGMALTLVNVLNIATLYHAGALSDRFGRKPVIWPSTVISGLSMVAFALSDSYLAYLGGALLWGLASGIAGPSPGAYITDLAPAALRGRIFGLYRTCGDAGYIAGPLLLGWLVSLAGFSAPLLLTAGMFVVAGGLFALFAPETHARQQTVGNRGRE